jgi:hypothetical protein
MTAELPPGPDPDATVALPTDRAFLVQFRPRTAGPFAGRVEHLASGRAARFGDWAGLRRFVDRMLREGEQDGAAGDTHTDQP